jgi:uncharacterized protein involved in exopolysaccharide biosynthesis
MRRVLEIVFSHWMKFIALLVIPIIIALTIVWVQPRQYEATATLWALQRYSVIGATGPEANLYATPASTQATALEELLQTRSFDLDVANETNLASAFDAATRADPNKLDDAIVQEISTKVISSAVGVNLYQITYDNKDPRIAKQIVSAVLDQFGVSATSFSIAEGKQLLQIYNDQLTQAQKASDDATKAAASYFVDHPNATTATDPIYSQLLQQARGAQANVANLQGQITKLDQSLATSANGSISLYKIVDEPRVDGRPISRVKTLALGGGIGVAVGLLAITLLLVALMRRDRSAYSSDDLRRIIDLPVALELPQFSSAIVAATMRRPTALPGRVSVSR